MGMSGDLYRRLGNKNRHWQRMMREKAYQRQTLSNHSKEFATILDAKKQRAQQKDKIDRMRRS